MLATLLAASIGLSQEVRTVTLHNGARLQGGGEGPAYWGCSDTSLNSHTPDTNFGGSRILEGGPGKVILIKFADLDRMAQGHRRVVKATLFLTPSSQVRGKLSFARRVLMPWGEGPETAPFVAPNPLAKAPPLSATWRNRRAGAPEGTWQQPGASGPSDGSPIPGARSVESGGEMAIMGLEAAIQQMLDSDFENRGLALAFSGPVEFFSSESRTGRPRLVLELAGSQPPTGPDLSVVAIDMEFGPSESAEKPWPKEGEEVTYKARVRNVGSEPAQGFRAAWIVEERPRSSLEIQGSIPPGQERDVIWKHVFRTSGSDHRVNPVGITVSPSGPDANRSNNALQIYPHAIPVRLTVSKAALDRLNGEVNSRGSRSAADALQGALAILNEVVLPKSRYSFAPDGALERFRLASVQEDAGTPSGSDVTISGGDVEVWRVALRTAGLITYEKMNATHGPGARPSRINGLDRHPGLLGGGSTLNETGIRPEIQLPYEPFYSPIFEYAGLEGTGLLAASDVAALNRSLGSALGGAKTLAKLPSTVLVRAWTLAEKPLGGVTLAFYQTNGGVISESPAFKVQTSPDGVAILADREGPGGAKDLFGGLQPDGSNGVFFVRAEFMGTSDATWLKAWHLADAYSRSGLEAVLFDLRFNLPTEEVDRGSNLARGRIVTDSADDLPAKLSGLVDGTLTKDVELPNTPGAWIEIDLGRDRPVAEINLIGAAPEFWNRFDVVTYTTGTTVRSALPWFRSVENTFGTAAGQTGSAAAMPLRGVARLMRTIRLICREPGATARLSEIEVHPAKAPIGQP